VLHDHTTADRSGSRTNAGHCRILIAERSEDAANAMARLFRLKGHHVEMAATGMSAIELAESFRPHVVLVDIGLPDVDGYAVASAIRARAGGRRIFVAAVTGWTRGVDRERAAAAGFDRFVTKPIDFDRFDELFAHFAGVCGSQFSQDGPARPPAA
jgi:CheY-like chemotaxis protein